MRRREWKWKWNFKVKVKAKVSERGRAMDQVCHLHHLTIHHPSSFSQLKESKGTYLQHILNEPPRETNLRWRKVHRDISGLLYPAHNLSRVVSKNNIFSTNRDTPKLLLAFFLLLVYDTHEVVDVGLNRTALEIVKAHFPQFVLLVFGQLFEGILPQIFRRDLGGRLFGRDL